MAPCVTEDTPEGRQKGSHCSKAQAEPGSALKPKEQLRPLKNWNNCFPVIEYLSDAAAGVHEALPAFTFLCSYPKGREKEGKGFVEV